MTNKDWPTEPDKIIYALHADQFKCHLDETKASLVGNLNNGLSPSYMAPAYWTSMEKEKFFNSLIIHSRLRPDLISASIGTKTTLDVCTYIDALEAALSENREDDICRGELETAVDVSDLWVFFEEYASQTLAANDSLEKCREESHRYSSIASNQCHILSKLKQEHLDVLEAMLEKECPEWISIGMENNSYSEDVKPPASWQCGAQDSKRKREHTLENDLDDFMESDLSHVSRRRLQKRLYMRRKRALVTGSKPVTAPGKLKAGRKRKIKIKYGSVNSQLSGDQHCYVVDGSDPDNALQASSQDVSEFEYEYSKSRRRQGRVGRRTRIKNEFTSNLIDAKFVAENQLVLFHLSCIGRLMKCFVSGYGHSGSGSVTCSSISADTIRLMAFIVMTFTRELVQRSIILQEQKRRMNPGNRFRREDDNDVSFETVGEVLSMMGVKYLTKSQYISQLLGENTELTVDTNSDDIDCYKGSPQGNEPDWSALSIDRELCPPLVHLPQSFFPDTITSSDEDCLFIDCNDEELVAELHEEDQLDLADMNHAVEQEAELWRKIGC